MRQMFNFALMGIFMCVSSLSFAQITGKVVDAETGESLPGAGILIEGSTVGTVTDLDGIFKLEVKPEGNLVFSFIGYKNLTLVAEADMGTVRMGKSAVSLAEASVVANVVDIAKARETPVAVSTIGPAEIANKVGNQEFPEIMNNTPGVYATKQGGGYGDSRLTLRGFDQRNTSFLINGQPVNDMENGWVYWSNWQGLTDVASGIQIQRGLGASRLAVPTVGGTVSIMTKAADREEGGRFSQTFGNDGYLKSSVNYSTGKSSKGWASSFLISRWEGDGYIDNTSGEGWTYFGAVGYAPEGSNHAFNLSVLGAAQWHHQRDVWVSIRDYQTFGEQNNDGINTRWNSNGGTLNGEEFSMRRNFYNKPLATLNWDWDISDNLTLNTSLYGSAGRGGGTGPRGRNYDVHPFRKDLYEFIYEDGKTEFRNEDGTINFDAIVAANQEGATPHDGSVNGNYEGYLIGAHNTPDADTSGTIYGGGMIRRASMNSHDWVGAISNLEWKKDFWRASVGVDLRKYKGYHYRVVNDLMGFDAYYSAGNSNSNGQIINTTVTASPFNNTGLNGPKINYYNVGNVGWAGANGLIEYNNKVVSGVIQVGISRQTYQREDYFANTDNPISDVAALDGGYVKGGANYNVDEKNNVFFNAGYISRQPLFDAVFPGFGNTINEDLENEKITSIEAGYGFTGRDLQVNVNAYSTVWGNRFVSQTFAIGEDDFSAQFRDIDVRHQGVELEATYRATRKLKLEGMVSVGDWKYTKDFDTAIFDDEQNQIGTGTLYLKDAKVGDAAQLTAMVGVDYRLTRKINVDARYRHVDGLYADYNIVDDTFLTPDNAGVLQLPSYGLLDLGTTVRFGDHLSVRANVNNALNTTYIAESNTNIHATEGSNTWNGIDTRNSVWFGFGRTWNASIRYNF
jgi:outer membrane receptor protein involved in Fe transport